MKLRSESNWRCLAVAMVTVSMGLFVPISVTTPAVLGEEGVVSKAKPEVKPTAASKSGKAQATSNSNDSQVTETVSDEPSAVPEPAITKPTIKRIVRLPALATPVKKVADSDQPVESTEPELAPIKEAETGKAAAPQETPSHEQIGTIVIGQQGDSRCTLNTFCLTPDGKIVAAVQCLPTQPARPGVKQTAEVKAAPQDKKLGELRVFDATGKALDVWPLEINPSAVNVGPDGAIYVAGSGRVLKLDSLGKTLLSSDAPNAAELLANQDAIVKEMAAQTGGVAARSKDVYLRAIEAAKKRVAELEEKEAAAKKEEKELSRSDKVRLTSARRSIESLEQTLENLREPTEEEKQYRINSALEYKKRMSAIAVTDKDVFVACASAVGWGYDVWQLDLNLANGTKIIEKLRGCCGQMDIQARGENVVVAENSMHRVSCYDRTGKLVKHFGERESISKLGFEGCCNPMNCRLGSGGEIYTSESSIGRIRKYSPDGEYVGMVGKANLISGCKHVAVAVNSLGDKVYLLDVTKGEILVMAKKGSVKTAAK